MLITGAGPAPHTEHTQQPATRRIDLYIVEKGKPFITLAR